MIFNSYKFDFKKLIKGFLQFSLSLMIISSSFHLYEHNHSDEDGYSICIPECESVSHHSLKHDCEECIQNRNQQKIIIITGIVEIIKTPLITWVKFSE